MKKIEKIGVLLIGLLFAVSASAATLSLTGANYSSFPTTGFSSGSFVAGTSSVSGLAYSDSSWDLTTDVDTTANFNIGFARLVSGGVIGLTLNNASFSLTEQTYDPFLGIMSIVPVMQFSLPSAPGFAFSYNLIAGALYNLQVTADPSGFTPTTTQLNIFSTPSLTAVPVPAALLLFAPVLLGVIGLRRKATRTTAV